MEDNATFAVDGYQLAADLYYDQATHLWVRVEEPTRAKCGFDPLGAETCGDIVAVSFEPVGAKVEKGEAFGSLEAAKFVGPLIAPISGTIARWNKEVLADPRLLNAAPMEHWLVEIASLRLEPDVAGLCHGAEEVGQWFASEIERFKTQGMVAE